MNEINTQKEHLHAIEVSPVTVKIAQKIVNDKDILTHIHEELFELLYEGIDAKDPAVENSFFVWAGKKYPHHMKELYLKYSNTDRSDYRAFMPTIKNEFAKKKNIELYYVHISEYGSNHVYGNREKIERFLKSVGIADSVIKQAKGASPTPMDGEEYQAGFFISGDENIWLEIKISSANSYEDIITANNKAPQMKRFQLYQFHDVDDNVKFIRKLFTETDKDIIEGIKKDTY